MSRTNKARQAGRYTAMILLFPTLIAAILIKNTSTTGSLILTATCLWSEYRLGFFK